MNDHWSVFTEMLALSSGGTSLLSFSKHINSVWSRIDVVKPCGVVASCCSLSVMSLMLTSAMSSSVMKLRSSCCIVTNSCCCRCVDVALTVVWRELPAVIRYSGLFGKIDGTASSFRYLLQRVLVAWVLSLRLLVSLCISTQSQGLKCSEQSLECFVGT